MPANRKQDLVRYAVLAVAIVVAAGAVVGADDVRGCTDCSITGRAGDLSRLAYRIAQCRADFQEYAANLEHYFDRGLGWRNDQGVFGFTAPGRDVFFGPKSRGFLGFDDSGVTVDSFGVAESEGTTWQTYQAAGERISVGSIGAAATRIDILLSDGMKIQMWPGGINVTLPGGARSYSLVYENSQPVLVLNSTLAAEVFSTKPPEGIIASLARDFPTAYYSRILSEAYKGGVDLSDPASVALYAFNWFRRLGGQPEAVQDPRLEAAALNHAQYLLSNGVIAEMMSWDATTIDLNRYLALHEEDQLRPGYTGHKVTARTTKTGYGPSSGENATFGLPDPIAEMVGWFHSIYHRRPFLDPRVRSIGYAHRSDGADESVGILNFGYVGSAGHTSTKVYPVDGERLVPFSWAARESPDPFPENDTPRGVPITVLLGAPDSAAPNVPATLTDESGAVLPLVENTILADPDHFREFLPDAPLAPEQWYTFSFSATGNEVRSRFKTAGIDAAVQLMSRLKDDLGGTSTSMPKGFDLDGALERNVRKGRLLDVQSGRIVHDEKYGFEVVLPAEWNLSVDREWQEVRLLRGAASINIALYNPGRARDRATMMKNFASSIELPIKSQVEASNAAGNGYRVVFQWDYPGKAIAYCFLAGPYVVSIYGYGVNDDEIDSVFRSFRYRKDDYGQ